MDLILAQEKYIQFWILIMMPLQRKYMGKKKMDIFDIILLFQYDI